MTIYFANATAFSIFFFICCMMNEWIMSNKLADVSLANHKWKAKPAPKTAKAGATQNPAAVESKKAKAQTKVKTKVKANKKTPLLDPSTTAPSAAPSDSTAAPSDSTAAPSDSTAAPEALKAEWKTGKKGADCDTICGDAGLICNADSRTKMNLVSFVFLC